MSFSEAPAATIGIDRVFLLDAEVQQNGLIVLAGGFNRRDDIPCAWSRVRHEFRMH